MLLLDADIAENEHDLRGVTDRLYGGDQDHRIKQEILLGIGGVRAIRAYTEVEGLPAPEVFHMNEGHAGFLGVERIRELIDAGLDFDTALTVVRASTVFTTHTPVPAGIDRFPVEMVKRYFGCERRKPRAASRLLPGVPLDRIIAFGAEDDPSKFNMAHMGLRLAQRANGVSLLHGRVSRHMFNELWPGFDTDEVPIGSMTNGVHAPTWAAPQMGRTGPRDSSAAGPGFAERARVVAAAAAGRSGTALVDLLAAARAAGRRRPGPAAPLLAGAWRVGCRIGLDRNGVRPGRADHRVRPRVPTYKRLTLMLREPERLEKLLLDEKRPMQLIVAGKSHPADDGGKALIQQVVRFADRPEVRHRIAFLPDYDMSMARLLYCGLRRLAEQSAAATGGVRNVGHEERAQRRVEPVDPRRLVGRVVRRRERLGDPDR